MAPSQVITDLAHGQHPAKAVFSTYGVTLRKLVIFDRYPVFEVGFPFDPQTAPNEKTLLALCTALLKANAMRPYALVAADDGVEFDVAWDHGHRKVVIENHAPGPGVLARQGRQPPRP